MEPADIYATIIRDAFEDYHARFADISRRAKRRFETRDWAAARIDAVVVSTQHTADVDMETLRRVVGWLRPQRDCADEEGNGGQQTAEEDSACTHGTEPTHELHVRPHALSCRAWCDSLTHRVGRADAAEWLLHRF